MPSAPVVVLLVPVVAQFARAVHARRAVPLAAAVAGHLAVYPFASRLGYLHESLWVAPAVLAWYLAVSVLARPAARG